MVHIVQQEGLDLFDTVTSVVEKHLHQKSDNLGFFPLPVDSYDALRQQYDAERILGSLAQKYPTTDLNLGLVGVDIYTHGMNYIFGLADPRRKTAVVSTFRLAGEHFNKRLSKEVIHELGHLLGFRHCADQQCVMHFSNTIEDTDLKGIEFCKKCRNTSE